MFAIDSLNCVILADSPTFDTRRADQCSPSTWFSRH
jgi:hypothetical protein